MPWIATFSDNAAEIPTTDFDYGVAFRVVGYQLVLNIDFTFTGSDGVHSYTAVGSGSKTILDIAPFNIPDDESYFRWDIDDLTNQPMQVVYNVSEPGTGTSIGTVTASSSPADPTYDGTFPLKLIVTTVSLNSDEQTLTFRVDYFTNPLVPGAGIVEVTTPGGVPVSSSFDVTIPSRSTDETRQEALIAKDANGNSITATVNGIMTVTSCLSWEGKWDTDTGENLENPLTPP